jgi:hypothetical protein
MAKRRKKRERKMLVLIVGLVLFLGTHTLTTFRATRAALIGRLGVRNFKIAYAAAAALASFSFASGFTDIGTAAGYKSGFRRCGCTRSRFCSCGSPLSAWPA